VPTNDTRVWKKQLERGVYDADVVYLQKALNLDGVYPAAILSGYYGILTEEAVKRFQEKYDIVSLGTPATTGYGRVGWSTMAKLNELYSFTN
jgi:peptidoglycan hydrolase-like protein with peptidoglycan-binding domain